MDTKEPPPGPLDETITKVSAELDNELWVEESFNVLLTKGSLSPIDDILSVLKTIECSSKSGSIYDKMQMKLERFFAKEIYNLDQKTQTQLKEKISAVRFIDYDFNEVKYRNGTVLKNMTWQGKQTWGFTFGSFVVVGFNFMFVTRLKIKSLKQFLLEVETLNKIMHNCRVHVFNGCDFATVNELRNEGRVVPFWEESFKRSKLELKQISQIMIRNKCSCLKPEDKMSIGYVEFEILQEFVRLNKRKSVKKRKKNPNKEIAITGSM